MTFSQKKTKKKLGLTAGADLGGGGEGGPPLLGIRPPADPNGPPWYFLRNPFLAKRKVDKIFGIFFLKIRPPSRKS